MLTSNLFLLSIAVLTLVVCIVLGVVLYFALHGAGDKPAADRKIVRLRSDSLRSTFRQAVELIESNIASRAERYNIPWVMVLDEGDDQPPLPIAQAGVSSVLGTDASSEAMTQGISWHFFDRGVVVDIKAAYLGSLDDNSEEKPWDEFLGLCRNYRQQRPFDSVVITVPAAMLLATDTDAQLELGRRAKLAHRRLWLAQNRFAMRFAVYVVVTGCEALEGFAEFARALPEPLRASMLGWSSPYDLSTTYSSDWVQAATASVSRAVSDTSAEIFALDAGRLDAREFLLLPARIEAMQAQLQLYVDELMRPSAYHEPFFFRGIYLTGDSSELAAQWITRPEAQAFDDGEPTFEPAADAADGQTALGHAALVQPAFLRDLFERKIFLEYGLTRPSGSQRLTRPVLNRALRWGGIAILSVWGIGMVVATVQFSHRNGELVAALGQLRGDTQERAEAAQRGQELSGDWYRRKALALISLDQHLKNDSVWSVFMPGSWGIVDDLDERVNERFEREFGEIAVTALQREMFARIGQLTGVGVDPSSGQLIIGDDCTAPPLPRSGANADSLAIEDQPEMLALQKYVDSAGQFDTALQALQSLQHSGQDNSDALRLVVRYTLGAELQGDVSGVLPYFYTDGRAARHVDVASGLNVPALSQALRCSFDKGALQLNQRLFANNPLLTSEKSVADHLNALSVMDPGAADFGHVTGSYRDVVAAINTQQDLLASGKAGWLHQPQFTPGPLYERTLQRAAHDRLLGEDLAANVRARDDAAFQAFRSELALRFGGPDSGVVWLDKDARYAVAPARLALRDGLTTLLNQPFMVAPRGLALPALPAGSTLVWDNAQLDQALALADVRKHFQTDGLTKLPAAIQPTVGQAVDAQFARLVFDQTAAAAAVAPVGGMTDSAAFDASHTRVAAIETLLTGMGATGEAASIGNLVSQDALAHLAGVDTSLTQSDLYATRDTLGYGGGGGGAPELAAFGVSSAAGLGAYLDQQAARALALGKDASVYLAALSPTDAESSLAQRWQAIDLDLDRYKLKNPNSSLLSL
ncbi:MAG TPA: type VI secretion system protein, partial [Paraburkholderia sp.]